MAFAGVLAGFRRHETASEEHVVVGFVSQAKNQGAQCSPLSRLVTHWAWLVQLPTASSSAFVH